MQSNNLHSMYLCMSKYCITGYLVNLSIPENCVVCYLFMRLHYSVDDCSDSLKWHALLLAWLICYMHILYIYCTEELSRK